MKISARLKIIAIVLTVILISLISFFGLYVKDNWKMKNLIPDYSFGMSLKGYKTAIFEVDTSEKDAPHEHEEDEEHSDDEEIEKIPVNSPEVLTVDNFKKCKEIVNTRLNLLKASEYAVRQNTEDGTIVVDITNEDASDSIIQNIYERGIFEARDKSTEEVLLTNSDVKNARVGYSQMRTGETYLLILISLNKQGEAKLEEISQTYTVESGKMIALYIDTLNFGERYFDAKITNGELSVPIATSAAVDLKLIEPEAKYMANLIKSEPMPIVYTVASYGFSEPALDNSVMVPVAIVFIILLIIIGIYFVYKYKNMGGFSVLNTIGFIAILLIVIRYTYSTITESGLFGIVLSTALQLLLSAQILEAIKDKENVKSIINTKIMEFVKTMAPLIIISVIFVFITWLPIKSLGMILFWGFIVNILLSMTIHKMLLGTLNESSKGGAK